MKPHWPYIAPAPYNDMYGPEHVIPVVRHERDQEVAHPVYKAFMGGRIGRAFSRDEECDYVVSEDDYGTSLMIGKTIHWNSRYHAWRI